jgi:hypothetical protein
MLEKTHGRARHITEVNIIERMCFACWVTKAIDTYSEHVILIAFPLQQWLYESASMLRYTYIPCLVFSPRMEEIWYELSAVNSRSK